MKNLARKNRNYISWSQFSLFKKSPEEYKRIYIDGGERYESEEMNFGRFFAEGLEKGSENRIIKTANLILPEYPKTEYEITTSYRGVKLKGVLDKFCPWSLKIGEIKTGKIWTQSQADNHGQLKFYNLLCLAHYGVLANEIRLFSFEVKNLKLTGKYKDFYVKHTLADIMLFFSDVKKVVEEIREITNKIYKSKEIK